MPSAERPQILDGEIVREMNDTEFAQYVKDQALAAIESQEEANRAALKAATIAKLGLTANEIAALLS